MNGLGLFALTDEALPCLIERLNFLIDLCPLRASRVVDLLRRCKLVNRGFGCGFLRLGVLLRSRNLGGKLVGLGL